MGTAELPDSYGGPVPLEPGLTASRDHVVTQDDTALSLGSGDVPVLGTPRVLAWLEGACCAAVAGELPDEATTVGVRVAVDHTAPTEVGATVTVEAVLEVVEGRRLRFAVRAAEGRRTVATGQVQRAVVDRQAFLRGLSGPPAG